MKKIKKNKKNKKNNNISIIMIGIFVIFFIIGFTLIVLSNPQDSNDFAKSNNKIISNNGIHWHANLKINIKGKDIIIPADIGISPVLHNPMHTHDQDGVIHLEYQGLVREDDLKLKKFFDLWDKKFNSNCIFDNCNGETGHLKMIVNGKENKDFEEYILQDKDNIQIIFE